MQTLPLRDPKVFGTSAASSRPCATASKNNSSPPWRWKPLASTGSAPTKSSNASACLVLVANRKHVKNLPGRKTDLKDCQCIATLHAHGLLRSGFVPPEHIRRLRADHVTLPPARAARRAHAAGLVAQFLL